MSDELPGPGRHLLIHRAPKDLVNRALLHRAPQAPWMRPMIAAAFFLCGVVAGQLSVLNFAPPAPAEATAASIEHVAVRLLLHAPDAQTVTVAGSWNDWGAEPVPLRRAEDGTFYTVIHLPRGRHEYMFVLDDNEWVTDPTALLTRDDGFGRQNALIEI